MRLVDRPSAAHADLTRSPLPAARRRPSDALIGWRELQDLLAQPFALRPLDESAEALVWTDASAGGMTWAVAQLNVDDQAGGRHTEEFERVQVQGL